MHRNIFVAALVLGLSTPALAQRSDVRTEQGLLGLSFGLTSLSGPTAGISYNLTQKFQLRGDIGLTANFAPATAATFDIGLAGRIYLRGNGPVAGFFQPGVTIGNPGGNAAFQIYGGFGLEYFFTPQLSGAGMISAGLNIAGSGGGSTAVGFSTARSGLAVNFYW